jgi:arginine exporter protein ArgO
MRLYDKSVDLILIILAMMTTKYLPKAIDVFTFIIYAKTCAFTCYYLVKNLEEPNEDNRIPPVVTATMNMCFIYLLY